MAKAQTTLNSVLAAQKQTYSTSSVVRLTNTWLLSSSNGTMLFSDSLKALKRIVNGIRTQIQFSSQILLFCWTKASAKWTHNWTLDAEIVVCVCVCVSSDVLWWGTTVYISLNTVWKEGNIWTFIHDKNINTGPVEQSFIEKYSNTLKESLTSAQCCTSQTLHLSRSQTKNINNSFLSR